MRAPKPAMRPFSSRIGDHDAMAEAVKAFCRFRFSESKPASSNPVRSSRVGEMLQSVVEALRRVTQPKGLDGCVGQSALSRANTSERLYG